MSCHYHSLSSQVRECSESNHRHQSRKALETERVVARRLCREIEAELRRMKPMPVKECDESYNGTHESLSAIHRLNIALHCTVLY